MQGVRRVDDGRVPDKSYDDSTWEGEKYTSAMDHPGCGDWASDFQDDLPGEGRPFELPSGSIPGPSGDEDGNAGVIPALEFPRHRGDSGGGKLPPPTVRPMRYAGPQAVPERMAPNHGIVFKGGGAEETTDHRGGDKGEFGAGLRGIWRNDKECLGILIPGEGVDSGRR